MDRSLAMLWWSLRVLLLGGFILSTSGEVLGQVGSPAAMGTFQLYTTDPKVPEVFSSELLVFVEANRAQDHDVVKRVGTVTWVKILARITITDPAFVPLPEGILPVDVGTFPAIPVER